MERKRQGKNEVSAHEIPAEVVGAVVLADLAAIETEAKTHQDPDARERIEKKVERLRQIVTDRMTPATQAELFKEAGIE